jgi:hypothetical protein
VKKDVTLNRENTDKSRHRLQPNLRNALIIVVLYAVYLSAAIKISGVPYSEIALSSSNLLNPHIFI